MVQIADLPVRLVKNKLIVDGAINGQKMACPRYRRDYDDDAAPATDRWDWSDTSQGLSDIRHRWRDKAE